MLYFFIEILLEICMKSLFLPFTKNTPDNSYFEGFFSFLIPSPAQKHITPQSVDCDGIGHFVRGFAASRGRFLRLQ